MNQQQLEDYLSQLSEAVDEIDASEADKEALNILIFDIENQLANPVVEEQEVNLVDQVDTLVSNFETDHPAVAGILNNIMVTLTSMGI
jgi:hypothetical protein